MAEAGAIEATGCDGPTGVYGDVAIDEPGLLG